MKNVHTLLPGSNTAELKDTWWMAAPTLIEGSGSIKHTEWMLSRPVRRKVSVDWLRGYGTRVDKVSQIRVPPVQMFSTVRIRRASHSRCGMGFGLTSVLSFGVQKAEWPIETNPPNLP